MIALSAERFRTWLLTCFAIAATLLATLGIGGLLAYKAAQRMQEFGVRIALGASGRNLVGLVFRHCLRLSSTGLANGLIASLVTTTLVAVSLILTLAAVCAAKPSKVRQCRRLCLWFCACFCNDLY